jgi:uncharacterized membrane protein YfcA
MGELAVWQLGCIALIFIWSGFVRSGLGFGGAALALPFLLLIENEPLVFLPLISIQLMVFSSVIAWQGHRQTKRLRKATDSDESNIDWTYLKKSLLILIIPKLLGVLGLLTLPSEMVTAIIFGIISIFAISYILNRPFKSSNKWSDILLLSLGGYFSGTSLIGAPLIVAVYASNVARHQLRDTLFVLWFILVVIKLTSFVIAGVDLQWMNQLWLMPCAFIGHRIGLKFHDYVQTQNSEYFYRVLGSALLLVCISGLLINLL